MLTLPLCWRQTISGIGMHGGQTQPTHTCTHTHAVGVSGGVLGGRVWLLEWDRGFNERALGQWEVRGPAIGALRNPTTNWFVMTVRARRAARRAHTQIHTETDPHTHRYTQIQTHAHTDTHRYTQIQTHSHTDTNRHKPTHPHTHTATDTYTYKQRGKGSKVPPQSLSSRVLTSR